MRTLQLLTVTALLLSAIVPSTAVMADEQECLDRFQAVRAVALAAYTKQRDATRSGVLERIALDREATEAAVAACEGVSVVDGVDMDSAMKMHATVLDGVEKCVQDLPTEQVACTRCVPTGGHCLWDDFPAEGKAGGVGVDVPIGGGTAAD